LQELIDSDWAFHLVIAAIVLLPAGAVYFTRGSQRAPDGSPIGLGGWLVIPIIGFIIVGCWSAYELYDMFTGENLLGTINIFNVENTDVRSLLRVPILGNALFNISMFVSAATCLFFVWTKKKATKNVALAHYSILIIAGLFAYWSNGVFELVMTELNIQDDDSVSSTPRFFGAIFWAIYFFESKRVKNTFVN
jgi:hypothetical protein